jgi:hypothetical protein
VQSKISPIASRRTRDLLMDQTARLFIRTTIWLVYQSEIAPLALPLRSIVLVPVVGKEG